MNCEPSCLSTSRVKLNASLRDLMEELAWNVHHVWAGQRTAEGWSFGPVRNDVKKHNPCLVDYQDLKEWEKKHFRDRARKEPDSGQTRLYPLQS